MFVQSLLFCAHKQKCLVGDRSKALVSRTQIPGFVFKRTKVLKILCGILNLYHPHVAKEGFYLMQELSQVIRCSCIHMLVSQLQEFFDNRNG